MLTGRRRSPAAPPEPAGSSGESCTTSRTRSSRSSSSQATHNDRIIEERGQPDIYGGLMVAVVSVGPPTPVAGSRAHCRCGQAAWGSSSPLKPRWLLRVAGTTADAIKLQERVLGNSERILGPGHPNTRAFRASLAAMTAGSLNPLPAPSPPVTTHRLSHAVDQQPGPGQSVSCGPPKRSRLVSPRRRRRGRLAPAGPRGRRVGGSANATRARLTRPPI